MVPPMTATKPASTLRDVSRDGESAEAPHRTEASTAPLPETEAPAKRRRSGLVLPVILLALLGGAGWYGYGWWTDGRFLVSTDDGKTVRVAAIRHRSAAYGSDPR